MDVKAEITEAVSLVDRLRGRAYHYSVRKLTPPAFLIDLPEEMNPHGAYKGGLSTWKVPFSVVVGSHQQESSEIELAEFTDEEGPRSVIRAVEDRQYTACSSVMVMQARPVVMTFAAVQYLGAEFDTIVVGKGY